MEHSEKIDKVAAALFKAQGIMPKAVMDSENPFFHSKYVSLNAILDVALPILQQCGLVVVQMGAPAETGHAGLTTMMIHGESGQYIAGTMIFPATTLVKEKGSTVERLTPQGGASATTYMRRYGIVAMLVIPLVDEDDDAEAAMKRGRSTPKASDKSDPLDDLGI